MFEGAFLKVERAQKHISDLEHVFDGFIKTCPHTFLSYNDPHTNLPFIEVRFGEQIPPELSLILGDAIHNLRTALDHATWELLGIDGGTQDRSTAFPFSRWKAEYDSACRGIETPFGDTKEFFVALAAHEGGSGEKLYALNRLDNADKHTALTPVIGMARVGEMELVQPNGETIMRMTNCRFQIGVNGRARLLDIPVGYTVKIDQYADMPLEIFFGDVEFLKGLPLIETLVDLSYAVQDVIGQFSDLVEGRKWC